MGLLACLRQADWRQPMSLVALPLKRFSDTADEPVLR
jgi:hypothetical protein